MQADVQTKQWTIDDLCTLEHDGYKCELVDGELVMSPANLEHEYIGARLTERLSQHVRKNGLGFVFTSSAGFVLGQNLRSPDVSFVSKERLGGAKRPPKKFGNFAPDLAVEILSPSDSLRRLGDKLGEYFESGTRLIWVIDPDAGTVTVYRSLTHVRVLTVSDNLDGGEVIPGFQMSVKELFDNVE
jgi:Uma2 family endonuclease